MIYFYCSETGKLFVDPVITDEGITYERSLYLPKSGESPPKPNMDIKKKLEELLEEGFIKKWQEMASLSARSEAGELDAMKKMAIIYKSGDFFVKNTDKAEELLKKISSKGREQASSLPHIQASSLPQVQASFLPQVQASSLPHEQASSMHVQQFPELQRALADGEIRRSVEQINMLTTHILFLSEFRKEHMDDEVAEKRHRWCKSFGWSIPSTDVTNAIVKHVGKDSVLSLAAGLAAQETLLAAKGVNIVCTDLDPPKETFMPVERLNNDEAVTKWRPHCEVAMLVWPEYIRRNWHAPRGAPFPDCHTYEALLKGNFPTVVYIGEERGVTGSEQLEDFLDRNYNKIRLTDDEKWPPSWPSIRDELRIFTRKSANVVPVPKPEVSPVTPESPRSQESPKSPTAYSSD